MIARPRFSRSKPLAALAAVWLALVWLAGTALADVYADIIAADPDPLTVGSVGDGANPAFAGFDIVLARDAAPGEPVFLYVDADRVAAKPGFALAETLYDNYELWEDLEEQNTQAEGQETVAFLLHVLRSPEVGVARDWLEARLGRAITDTELRDLVLTRWFRQFKQGGDPDLSGFEHVFVGEGQNGGVQGLHFWHRYWRLEQAGKATVLRDKRDRDERQSPSVTLSFEWAADQGGRTFLIEKPTGGFLAGLTPSALIAIGLVRGALNAAPPEGMAVSGHRFDWRHFEAPNGSSIRTLYTVYRGRDG